MELAPTVVLQSSPAALDHLALARSGARWSPAQWCKVGLYRQRVQRLRACPSHHGVYHV